MQSALILSFLVMGFLGSWHCGLMCGPLCSNFKTKKEFMYYQLGRLVSYMLVGSLLFFGVKYLLNVDSRPFKFLASILYGVLFIFFGLAQLKLIGTGRFNLKYAKLQFTIFQKNKLFMQRFPLALGLFTGLLPCAWLYSFLFLSTQMNSLSGAYLLIFIFWATALPAFAVFTCFMQNMIRSSPASHRKISACVLIVAGVFSIAGHWV